MMNSRFDTVIFDLDGTLADTAPDVLEGVNHALDRLGFPPISLERVKQAIGPGREAFVQAVFPDGADPDMEAFIDTFRGHYWDHCLDRTTLFPGMEAVLLALEDRTLAVASNKPRRFTEKILEGLGIRKRFDDVVGPEDVARPKPCPDMILKILDGVGDEPARVLFVGDTDKDMVAGRGAGVTLCGVRYGYGVSEDLERENPDFLVDRPLELLDVVVNSRY